ncbi:hypothetical protein B5X24_HaOG215383 [Helicoverpa armigera]|uniref:Uncharacterized protein n=1 Tax=Helicoverpa armigera TaxID=29058 RepID=A0A2W1B5F0_HELAM|nr:hypothetical protein B5X24_HaOG215383 [Helicoverpa armigera]
MLRLCLVILLTHRIRTAHVTDTPFTNRFDRLYQKLDRLNSLSPELTDEDEEQLLSAMKAWGGLSSEQMDGVMKDLQRMKVERTGDTGEQDYGESSWDDEVCDRF